MKAAIRPLTAAVAMTCAMTCALALAAWAGGSGFGDDDDNTDETGPSYFGFVRDTSGSTVPDAKEIVQLKHRISIVTRPDAQPAPIKPQMAALISMLTQPRHAKLALAGEAENWPRAGCAAKELRQGFLVVSRAVPR